MRVAKKKAGGRKVRVDFRQNRNVRARSADWTKRFREEDERAVDSRRGESLRPKDERSRKRTVIEGGDKSAGGKESGWCSGVVRIVHGLICYVDDAQGRTWECTVRRILRTLLIENRSPVAVGDRVRFSDQTRNGDQTRSEEVALVGVIERVEPRRSVLSRRDRRGRAHAIVANADQLLIVVSVAQPGLKPHLIDRYIVAAVKGRLQPVVCLNKVDLAKSATIESADLEELAALDELVAAGEELTVPRPNLVSVTAELRAIGYAVLQTSIVDGRGLDELRAALALHTTVLSGQSGVGKSSLLNALQPGLRLTIAEVSRENEKGRHTTTHAQLIRLDSGGYVVDTPGIRSFDLWSVAPNELEACFVEFAPFLQQCRYRDCLHKDEDECAVRAAALDGQISLRRYLSYRKMYEDALSAWRGERADG